ncbi:hypothetical protein QIS74_13667 [Colletotrichum tabaci]|uniref:Uncharacterized protein n=1 Tax=Colletotrichum tabaci TaxID=1209068 RepID=A0AAV9SV24_9PEZI
MTDATRWRQNAAYKNILDIREKCGEDVYYLCLCASSISVLSKSTIIETLEDWKRETVIPAALTVHTKAVVDAFLAQKSDTDIQTSTTSPKRHRPGNDDRSLADDPGRTPKRSRREYSRADEAGNPPPGASSATLGVAVVGGTVTTSLELDVTQLVRHGMAAVDGGDDMDDRNDNAGEKSPAPVPSSNNQSIQQVTGLAYGDHVPGPQDSHMASLHEGGHLTTTHGGYSLTTRLPLMYKLGKTDIYEVLVYYEGPVNPVMPEYPGSNPIIMIECSPMEAMNLLQNREQIAGNAYDSSVAVSTATLQGP